VSRERKVKVRSSASHFSLSFFPPTFSTEMKRKKQLCSDRNSGSINRAFIFCFRVNCERFFFLFFCCFFFFLIFLFFFFSFFFFLSVSSFLSLSTSFVVVVYLLAKCFSVLLSSLLTPPLLSHPPLCLFFLSLSFCRSL